MKKLKLCSISSMMNMMIPYGRHKTLYNASRYLKPRFSLEILDGLASEINDKHARDVPQKAQKGTLKDSSINSGYIQFFIQSLSY
jgi:hypothetical protein